MKEIYIAHPITGKPMDKSQCKRIITQMAAEIAALKKPEVRAAIERDTPQKVLDTVYNDEYGICPICGADVEKCSDKFCFSCGQRLDWSE